ncbi:uncharacterized protein LOC107825300 [Nicotiana tabacum]|uniref:Uncharacterized protein LOC107825300 n=1 Tax=Nicotiana tabacum TaxID=4097 RepID=A0AC58S6R1_TOBAC
MNLDSACGGSCMAKPYSEIQLLLNNFTANDHNWQGDGIHARQPAGALPSDTKPNPKAQVNAVTLRNGRALEEVPKKKKNTDHPEGELAPKPVEGNDKDDKGLKPEVPKYARYLRDIVTNKQRHAEFETVALTEECSARVQSKFPPKLKDPGSFTIPLSLGKQEVGRALCDLGASINLMPSSLFKQLGLGALRPTTITL